MTTDTKCEFAIGATVGLVALGILAKFDAADVGGE